MRESDHSFQLSHNSGFCACLLPFTDERPNLPAESVARTNVCEQFSSGDNCNKHQHSVTLFSDLYSGTVGAVVLLGDTGKAGTLLWATWCHRACFDAQVWCSLRSALSQKDGSSSNNVPEASILVWAWVPAVLTGWLVLTRRLLSCVSVFPCFPILDPASSFSPVCNTS